VDALVLRDRDADSNGSLEERLWVQQDANYNVTALVNGSGSVVERYAYDPYGQVTVYEPDYSAVRSGSSYAWVYLHQGGRFEVVSGLYHFRRRDYSPTLGRWLEVDPIGLRGGDGNLYRYLSNTPTGLVDPSGLLGWDPRDVYHDEFTAEDRMRWLKLTGMGYQIVIDDSGNARGDFETTDNIDVEVTDELIQKVGGNGIDNHWAVDRDNKTIWIDAVKDRNAASSLRDAMDRIEELEGLSSPIETRRPDGSAPIIEQWGQVDPALGRHWKEGCRDSAALAQVAAEWNATVLGGGFLKPGAWNITPELEQQLADLAARNLARRWTLGSNHTAAQWANRMARGGWTPQQIAEAIANGQRIPAPNKVNPGNIATRYVHPTTGLSVIVDNVTGEVIHVGAQGFKY
jgi:RHS repeat-associated protein